MRLIKLTMLLSLIVLVISFFQRDHLSTNMSFDERLKEEPRQYRTHEEAFSVLMNARSYYIEPLYDYTLYGMVVSLKQHNGDTGLHKAWNDHLNVADLCVVWSDTAFSPHLNKVEFWNGQFTCFFQTNDRQAWENFNGTQLSNNHLITDNEYLRDKIKDISIGDQIKINGWLANYQGSNGNKRGTSIVRTDTGNGACETIYVNDVQILTSYISHWRIAMYASFCIFVLSLYFYFKAPIRNY